MEEEKNNRQCRVIKNKNFTVMINIHLRAKDISLKAKGLMSLCLSLPENWDYSIAGLVTLSSDGRDSVTNALNELKKCGFLVSEKRRVSGGFFKSFYTFYENPEENPNFNGDLGQDNHDGKPVMDTDNHDGFTDAVEPMQLSQCSLTTSANPEEINTNNKELKSNTKNKKNKEVIKNIFGEFQNVSLTDVEETKLRELYNTKFEEAIGKLGSYKFATGKKYKSDYAVLNKHNWVYKTMFPNGKNNNVVGFEAKPTTQSKYANCYN